MTDDAETPRPAVHAQRLFRLPSDAREVILVRHGASMALVEGQAFPLTEDGHGDPPLAPEGHQQAERVGERLAGETISRLFVTSLTRTHQTAAPYAARSGLEPEVVHDLREVHLGDWEAGEYRARVAARDPLVLKAWMEGRWDHIPGAETNEALAERTRRGLDHVFASLEPGTVGVAVVHGGVIAELCRQVTGSETFAFMGADNTSMTRIVELGFGLRRLRSFNDTAHLDGLRTEEPLV
ncbi:phosphoglycerate mutase family protein [Patulibacter medicamentivorans]|uniref:Phosphoglycerate mutase family protein n=1 Tax=Patulibacter medicamentivorans TaxID=1097667 RepID=H0E504_9ACTN|nr:histidine phosphatase family protein [Patulibacter medicamentivorans]EHN11233.1 phosphoglycerate mutase family protein [Patulibacter medicamentivorans]